MNYRCAYFVGGCFCLFCFCASMPALAWEPNDLNNPGFEIYDYNETFDFNVPTNWRHIGYTAVMNHFNSLERWVLNQTTGLNPYEGEFFVMLSTGDMSPEPNFAEIRQRITINASDRLTGAYFFGTSDWTPYDDWGAIQLVLPDTNTIVVEIVKISVADVESYRSMRGWQRFDKIFSPNEAGEYDLRIFLSDKTDFVLNSYLAVDGLVICPNSPIYGDLNADCSVNFQDFAMLATDWMCDCNDPNIFDDPNQNCIYGTDFDDSNLVDFADLQVIIENWLLSTIQGIIEE